MKLFITKNQAKGVWGGNIVFELSTRVELSPEEIALVNKYNVGKEVLLERKPVSGAENLEAIMIGRLHFLITIEGFMKGQTFKNKNIGELLETERNVKEACEKFKNYLEVMKGFGGEEFFEYK